MGNIKLKNKGGRPRTDTQRVMLTLSKSDFELLEAIASKTNTRPATMVHNLVVECRPTYQAMLKALESIDLGHSDKALEMMTEALEDAKKRAESEDEDSKK